MNTLEQELSMTSEIRDRLMSRSGFVTHWDDEISGGNPICQTPPTRKFTQKKIGGRTKKEVCIIQQLSLHGPMTAASLAKALDTSQCNLWVFLQKMVHKGKAFKDDETKLYYLSKPKVLAKRPPTKTEQIRAKAKELGTFHHTELLVIASWAYVVINQMHNDGVLVNVKRGWWKWVGTQHSGQNRLKAQRPTKTSHARPRLGHQTYRTVPKSHSNGQRIGAR